MVGWKSGTGRSKKVVVADVPMFNGRPLDFRQLCGSMGKRLFVQGWQTLKDVPHHQQRPQNEILWAPAAAVKKIQKARYAEMVLHEM